MKENNHCFNNLNFKFVPFGAGYYSDFVNQN
jgi:hypothetical protein